jgi:hypothetical protein
VAEVRRLTRCDGDAISGEDADSGRVGGEVVEREFGKQRGHDPIVERA